MSRLPVKATSPLNRITIENMSTTIKNFQVRDWRTSKYPLRIILRVAFVTYMWYGIWNYYCDPAYMALARKAEEFIIQNNLPRKPGAHGFEYLTMIGYTGTSLTLILSCAQEFLPNMKGFKVGMNGLFLVVEAMITMLYWSLYFTDKRLILDEETFKAIGPPPLFMDTAAHLVPFIAMIAEFLFSRTSKSHLYNNRIIHIIAIIMMTFGYFVWILYLFNENEQFPYPFLRIINQPARIAFTFFSSCLGLFIYGIASRAYMKYHATEDDLPVLEEKFYDDEYEEE